MRVRHLVSADNVDAEGFVIDPLLARHGVVAGGRVAAVSAPIDPLTHLNLDFPAHRLDECLVAERLALGAAVQWQGDRFRVARARRAEFARRGEVDLDERRTAWQRAVSLKSSDGTMDE